MSMIESRYVVEKEWECTKLLVCEDTDRRYLAFALGEYGVYLESFSYIDPDGGRRNTRMPGIATVRYNDYSSVIDFIRCEPQFKASIIFKHGKYFSDLETDAIGLANNVILNALGLREESIFYIESSDKDVQDLFYKTALKINEQYHLGCKFDCDCYNYKITIKKYNKRDGKFVLVVIMTGLDMPNTWKFCLDEFCDLECECSVSETSSGFTLGNYTVSTEGTWELTKSTKCSCPTHAAPEPECTCSTCKEECFDGCDEYEGEEEEEEEDE